MQPDAVDARKHTILVQGPVTFYDRDGSRHQLILEQLVCGAVKFHVDTEQYTASGGYKSRKCTFHDDYDNVYVAKDTPAGDPTVRLNVHVYKEGKKWTEFNELGECTKRVDDLYDEFKTLLRDVRRVMTISEENALPVAAEFIASVRKIVEDFKPYIVVRFDAFIS
jgi:hypothetical protein